MRAPASLLHRTVVGELSSSPAPPSTREQQQAGPTMAVDSNMVVILASLLCALVCVLGLALVSRCACRRHRTSSSSDHSPPPKGLKKKVIDTLPTVSFFAAAASPPGTSSPAAPVAWSSSSECVICLVEFVDGERLRVLPQCRHGFHVACVDAWLRTNASCPSCRCAIVAVEPAQPVPPPAAPTVVVVVAGGGGGSRCGRCGELAEPTSGGDAAFLP